MEPAKISIDNLESMFASMRPVHVTPTMSTEAALDCITFLGKCGQHTVGVVCFDGETAWERHNNDDELLYVVDGAVELTCATDDQFEKLTARTGDLIRVPAGVWHAQKTIGAVRMIFFTVAEGSERSVASP